MVASEIGLTLVRMDHRCNIVHGAVLALEIATVGKNNRTEYGIFPAQEYGLETKACKIEKCRKFHRFPLDYILYYVWRENPALYCRMPKTIFFIKSFLAKKNQCGNHCHVLTFLAII